MKTATSSPSTTAFPSPAAGSSIPLPTSPNDLTGSNPFVNPMSDEIAPPPAYSHVPDSWSSVPAASASGSSQVAVNQANQDQRVGVDTSARGGVKIPEHLQWHYTSPAVGRAESLGLERFERHVLEAVNGVVRQSRNDGREVLSFDKRLEEPKMLEAWLVSQAREVPRVEIKIKGSHIETHHTTEQVRDPQTGQLKRESKGREETVVDFDLSIDLTPILLPTLAIPAPANGPTATPSTQQDVGSNVHLYTARQDDPTYRGSMSRTFSPAHTYASYNIHSNPDDSSAIRSNQSAPAREGDVESGFLLPAGHSLQLGQDTVGRQATRYELKKWDGSRRWNRIKGLPGWARVVGKRATKRTKWEPEVDGEPEGSETGGSGEDMGGLQSFSGRGKGKIRLPDSPARSASDTDGRPGPSMFASDGPSGSTIYHGSSADPQAAIPSSSAQVDETAGGEEVQDGMDLKAWCEAYCADERMLKSFEMQREVWGWDTEGLFGAIKAAVLSTGYPASSTIQISIEGADSKIIVRPDNWANRLLFKSRFLHVLLCITLIYPLIWIWMRFFGGGARYSTVTASYGLKYFPILPSSFPGETLASAQARLPQLRKSHPSLPLPVSVGPSLHPGPLGVHHLAGQKEGVWFREWEDRIRMGVRMRYQGRLEGGGEGAGEGLDGY